MQQHLGPWGEQIVTQWFEWQGYKVIGRNYLTPYGEVDLWVRRESRSYLVEVKTRSSWPENLAVSGLTPQKIKRLNLIRSYLRVHVPPALNSQHHQQLYCAFVLLVPQGIYWIPDIFQTDLLLAHFPRPPKSCKIE